MSSRPASRRTLAGLLWKALDRHTAEVAPVRTGIGTSRHVPMGILTPTNSPFCSAGPTESTVFPSTMPMAMARMIHITRNRSRKERPLSGGRIFSSSVTCKNTAALVWLIICSGSTMVSYMRTYRRDGSTVQHCFLFRHRLRVRGFRHGSLVGMMRF
jgi:hypothetical protein